MKFFLSLAHLGFLPKGGGFLAAAFAILLSFYFPIFIYLNFFFVVIGTYFVHQLKLQDPKWVVLDEVVGGILIFSLTQITTFTHLIFILLLFTFLDTFKPFPIYIFDRKDHAIFVFLDDIVAALIGAGLYHFISFLFQFFQQKSL